MAAYLAASTPTVTNVFEPGKVPPEIDEDLEGNVKKNVTVKNMGNVDAYIRAKIVVTWQDDQGNVYPVMPVGTDYTIAYGDAWTKESDGFWYYNGKVGAVAPNNETEVLITECKPVDGKAPAGYTLHVEILAQAIQADGWPDTVTNAQLAFAEAAR